MLSLKTSNVGMKGFQIVYLDSHTEGWAQIHNITLDVVKSYYILLSILLQPCIIQ